MNCPNCNHPMDDDAFFCKNCGAWIIQKDQPDAEKPVQPKPRRKPSKRRVRRRNLMIACLMLVLVLAVVAIYFLALAPMLRGEDGTQTPNTVQTDPNTEPTDSNPQGETPTPDQPTDETDSMVPPDQTTDPGDDTTVPPDAPTEPDEPEVPDTPAETAHYLLPSDSRLITESDLQGMSREDVALARNEIYARHGRTFRNETYQAYFDSQSWYTPDPNYSDDTVNLSETEKANAQFILSYEQAQGWQ